MSNHIDTEMLRSVVREVLREVVGEARAAGDAAQPARVEEVRIDTDADLAAFVHRLAALCADAQAREAVHRGDHAFRLQRSGGGGPTPAPRAVQSQPPVAEGPAHRIDREVLSEAKVISLAKVNRRLLLGRGVVVTPLARDKARQLGLQLEREK